MNDSSITVWFLCKSCGYIFESRTVEQYIAHKKQKHSSEFQKTQCVVFEERQSDDNVVKEIFYSSPTLTTTSSFDRNDGKVDVDGSFQKLEVFLDPEEPEEAKFCKIENLYTISDVNASVVNTRSKLSPYVRLERLTPEELDISKRKSNSPSDSKKLQSVDSDSDSNFEPENNQDSYDSCDSNNLDHQNPAVPPKTSSVNPIKSAKPTKNQFSCEICSKSFPVKAYLSKHHKTHSGYKPFKCRHPDCFQAYSTSRGLRVHKEIHLKRRVIPVEVLSEFPSTLDTEGESNGDDPIPLTQWLEKVKCNLELEGAPPNIVLLDPDPRSTKVEPITEESPITCKLCCERLRSETEVKIHVTHCWLRNKLRHRHCVLCDKTFLEPKELKRHAANVHSSRSKRKFQCPECGREFAEKRSLVGHVESHKSRENQSRPHVCEICGAAFTTTTYLREHRGIHNTDRPFKCSYPNCNHAYKTKSNLKTHRKVHSEVLYKCPMSECDKTFRSRDGLKIHVQGHSGQRFECTEANCDQTFASRSNLNVHIRRRHREVLKEFVCEVCGKNFADRGSLKGHAVVHLPEKRFKCPQEGCSSGFNERRALVEHERVHRGEQPYQCELCGNAFYRIRELKYHMKVHQKNQESQDEIILGS